MQESQQSNIWNIFKTVCTQNIKAYNFFLPTGQKKFYFLK